MKWIWLAPLLLIGLLLALLTVLLLLRVGIVVQYDEVALRIRVRAGLIRFTVFPRPHKKRKRRKKQKEAGDTPAESLMPEAEDMPLQSTEEAEQDNVPIQSEKPVISKTVKQKNFSEKMKNKTEKQKISVHQICEYARFGVQAGGRMMRGLRVDKLCFYAGIGGGDARMVALSYGAAAAAVSSVLPLLESVLRIRKKDIFVEACFDQPVSQLKAELEVTAVVGRVLLIALSLYREYLKLIQKKAVQHE